MHMEGALAAPLPPTYEPRLARAAAVVDPSIRPVDGAQAPPERQSTAGSTSPQRNLDQAAERSTEQRLGTGTTPTAEDFATIQAQLGLRLTGAEALDRASGVALVDRDAELGIQEIPPAPERQPRDFSEAVADAVVTIEEYLDWVNEAGGKVS